MDYTASTLHATVIENSIESAIEDDYYPKAGILEIVKFGGCRAGDAVGQAAGLAGPVWAESPVPSSSVSLGSTKEIASFDWTKIAKCQLYQGNLSTFGEPLRSGLIKLMSPIRLGQS